MTEEHAHQVSGLSPEVEAMTGVYALYWKLEESIDEMGKEPDLTRQELHMLIKLEQPKRMGRLAQDMLTVPSTITATADTLEQGGYLTRERDPDDRRAWLLVLTPLGLETRQEIMVEAGQLFRDASGLTHSETAEFARLARKIKSNILISGIPEGLAK